MPIVPATVPNTAPAASPTDSMPAEPLLVRWSRLIVNGVAEALGTTPSDVDHRLTPHRDLPVGRIMHTAFTVEGHRVQIIVDWPDPWLEPRYATAVDGTVVEVDMTTSIPPGAVLAYAAWQAVTATTTPAAGAGAR